MNKKLKILIGVIIVLVFVLFIVKNVFALTFDESKSIEKLKQAVIDKDVKYLEKHLEIENYKSKPSSKEIENIAAFLKNQNIMEKDWNSYYNKSNKNFYIKKSGKENIFLDKYVLVLKPYQLILNSDTPEAIVYVDGKEMGKIEKESCECKCSPILLGTHNIKLEYKGEYVTLKNEEKVHFFDEDTQEIHCSINLEPTYIDVFSNHPEAKLFVNGKDTGKTIEEINGFGPVAFDGSIVLQAKLTNQGKTFESKKTVVDDYICDLYINMNDEDHYDYLNGSIPIEAIIEGLILAYEQDLVYAINNNDFEIVEPHLLNGSPLYEAQKNLVTHLNEKGIKEELLDYDILDIEEIDSTTHEATVYEKFNIIYSDDKQEEKEFEWIYTIKVNEEGIYLTHIKE